ncbi:MAG: PHP domain-containing protein [Anaerolineae bacterium]
MLIDLHMHTSRYSACGKASPEEMVEAAIAAGLDAIQLTEHDRIWPLAEVQALRSRYPELRIFRGLEAYSDHSRADIIVLGVLEWTQPGGVLRPHEIVRLVHSLGGVAVLAHPFRLAASIPGELLLDPPDAYEVGSLNMPVFARERARQLQRLFPAARPVVASDAHQTAGVGAYAIELEQDVANEAELAAAVLAGEYRLSLNRERLRERAPHWQRIQERIGALASAGASYRQIRSETGYNRALVRHVMRGGDLRQ